MFLTTDRFYDPDSDLLQKLFIGKKPNTTGSKTISLSDLLSSGGFVTCILLWMVFADKSNLNFGTKISLKIQIHHY